MRKAVAVMLALLLLCGAGAVYIFISLFTERDRVTFTEEVLYGETAAADGLTVGLKSTYDNLLFWNTQYQYKSTADIGTDYRFYPSQHYDVEEYTPSGVFMTNKLGVDFDINSTDEPTGLGVAFREIYNSIAPGEIKTVTVFLKDYCDYYPMGLQIGLPEFQLNNMFYSYSAGNTEAEQKVIDAMTDFFRIPVLENEQVTLTVNRSGNDALASQGSGVTNVDNISFHFSTVGTLTENAAYFTFFTQAGGATVDTSLIPGGYGIYCLPYDGAEVKTDELRCVYPLDTATKPVNLTSDAAGDRLLLYTEEGNNLILTVIDIATMTEVQRIDIGNQYDNSRTFYEGDDYQVIWFEENEIVVLERDENGTYFVGMRTDISASSNVFENYYYYNGMVTDYHDGKLAVAGVLYKEFEPGGGYVVCGYLLSVYDADGLQYAGAYESSLSDGVPQSSRSYDCYPDNNPISVAWGE